MISADLKARVNEYRLWLIGKGLTAGTAATYATYLRKILVLDIQADADLDTYFSSLPGRQRSYYMAAWRKYAEWMARSSGVGSVHVPGEGKRAFAVHVAKNHQPMSPDLVKACRAMIDAGMSAQTLILTRWVDVEMEKRFYPGGVCKVAVVDVTNREQLFKVPFEAIDTLVRHFNPTDLDLPLIPFSLEPVQFYTMSAFNRELRAYDLTPLQKADLLRKEMEERKLADQEKQDLERGATVVESNAILDLDDLDVLDAGDLEGLE